MAEYDDYALADHTAAELLRLLRTWWSLARGQQSERRRMMNALRRTLDGS